MKLTSAIKTTFLATAITATLAACSITDSSLDSENPGGDISNNETYNKTPLLVFLGETDFFSITATRGMGPFENKEDVKKKNAKICVYAFRNSTHEPLTDPADLRKTRYANGKAHDEDNESCLLDGYDYNSGMVMKLNENDGQLRQPEQDSEKLYYSNTYQNVGYNFFAYYTDDCKLTCNRSQDKITYEFDVDGTQVIANLNIDGTQDVIWGKTTNDDVDAYSAHYFRQLEHSTEIPSLAFSHKLMRLTFSCKPGKDVHDSIEPAKKMGVKSIVIMGVPTRGSLIIADKDNAQNEGVLTFDQNSKSDLALRDNNDKPMTTTYWVMDDEREIGQGILVPVPESADMHYYILVTMVDKDGNTFVPEHPAMLDNGATPFVAGKSYNVSLTIHGPREIDLNATLNKWIEDDETIDGIIL